MKEQTYEDVRKEWGNSRYKSVFYKDRQLFIILVPREVVTLPLPYKSPYRKAFYVGTFKYTPIGEFWSKRTSFESIHYDKVVSRFQRFVDEYCTDWRPVNEWMSSSFPTYKGFNLTVKKEYNVIRYFGTCEIHKNSTFKCISGNIKEIEEKFKARIDRVVGEKEKVTKFTQDFNRVGSVLANGARKLKIQELEQLQARISAQLEELKKEKDTWIYKGVVLEYGTDEELDEGYFVGRIKNAPEGTEEFYGKIENVIKSDLENYIDKLEDSYNLYRKLTGKEE